VRRGWRLRRVRDTVELLFFSNEESDMSPSINPMRRLALAALPALWLGAADAAGVAKLAVTDLMPWSEVNPRGELTGILVETGRQLARLSGEALDVTPLPYARALHMLGGGQVQLMLALQTARLDQLAVPIAPVGEGEIALLTRAGLDIDSVAALEGKRVGHLRLDDYGVALATSPAIIRYEISSYAQGLLMLDLGRIDALLASRTTLLYTAKMLDIPLSHFGPLHVLRRKPVMLYLSRHGAQQVSAQKLKQACGQILQQGAIRRLSERALATPPRLGDPEFL
jgi:polar amino acid transport system substrate-binding protein